MFFLYAASVAKFGFSEGSGCVLFGSFGFPGAPVRRLFGLWGLEVESYWSQVGPVPVCFSLLSSLTRGFWLCGLLFGRHCSFFGVLGANSVAQGINLVAFLALRGFFCRFTLIAQAWAGRSFHHYSGHEARYTKWYQSGLDPYHEPGIP